MSMLNKLSTIQSATTLLVLALSTSAALAAAPAPDAMIVAYKAGKAAAVRAEGMAPQVEPTLARFISAEGQAARPEVVATLRALLQRADPAGYAASCEAIRDADFLGQLGQLRCPTLVISGERDPGTPPALGQQIADAVPGARHLLIPAAAHASVLEQPRAFADAVLGLLAGLA